MPYLREESHYENLYDIQTIKEGLWQKESFKRAFYSKCFEEKGFRKGEKIRVVLSLTSMNLYYYKGERYQKRTATINEWMEKDLKRDQFFENTSISAHINCPRCIDSPLMRVISKDFHDSNSDPMRVLFLFECSICKKRRFIFDTGEEYVSKPSLCPRCGKTMDISCNSNGDIFEMIEDCSYCGFHESDITDFAQMRMDRLKQERSDRRTAPHKKPVGLASASP